VKAIAEGEKLASGKRSRPGSCHQIWCPISPIVAPQLSNSCTLK